MSQVFTGLGLGLSGMETGAYTHGGYQGRAQVGQWGAGSYVNIANGNMILRQSQGFQAMTSLGFEGFETYNAQDGGWRLAELGGIQFEGAPGSTGSRLHRIRGDGHSSLFLYDSARGAYYSTENPAESIRAHAGLWEYRLAAEPSVYQYNSDGRLAAIRDADGHCISAQYAEGHLVSLSATEGRQTRVWTFSKGQPTDLTVSEDAVVLQHIHYTRDAQQRLTLIQQDIGGNWWTRYTYDDNSTRISGITQADGSCRAFTYDTLGRIITETDGAGQRTTYTYTQNTTTITDAGGHVWVYHYDTGAHITAIEGPLGYVARYRYTGDLLTDITEGSAHWQFSYNPAGDCILVIAPDGQITTRGFDTEHHLLTETVAGATSRFVYNAAGHLRFSIDALGRVTEYRYNTAGMRTSMRTYPKTFTDTTVTLDACSTWSGAQDAGSVTLVAYAYDWRGQCVAETRYTHVDSKGAGITTSDTQQMMHQYDAFGRLIESIAAGKHSYYTYDQSGRLTRTRDAQGHVTETIYDDAQQRSITRTPAGLTTIVSYDRNGLCISVQESSDTAVYDITTYRYNAEAQRIAETHTDGRSAWYFYDARGRLQASLTESGQAIVYTYDADDHLIATRTCFTALAPAFAEILPDWERIAPAPHAEDRIATWAYNPQGLLAETVDVAGVRTLYTYDAAGRISSKRLAGGIDRVTHYTYDALGRLHTMTDPGGFVTAYQYNRFDAIAETIRFATPVAMTDAPISWPPAHADDIHTYALYDDAGQCVARIDGEGYVTSYQYNAEGLMTQMTACAQAVPTARLTADMQLEQLHLSPHSEDRVTHYTYTDGALTQETRPEGLEIRYTYDAAGRLTAQSSHADKLVRGMAYRYDAQGRVMASISLDALAEYPNAWETQATRYSYDQAGRVIAKTTPDGTTQYVYDTAGNLRFTLDPTGALHERRYNIFNDCVADIHYAHSGILPTVPSMESLSTYAKAIQCASDSIQQYRYNAHGQLIHTDDGVLTTGYTYNAFGEMEQVLHRHYTSTLEYDVRGLLVARAEDGIVTRTAYDAFGRATKNWDSRNVASSMVYNHRDERIAVTGPLSPGAYIHDAFGRVIQQTENGITTTYHYDNEQHSLIITDSKSGARTTLTYNAWGDTIQHTDAAGYTTRYRYDAEGRLTDTEGPEGTHVTTHYDTMGRIQRQDVNGNVHRYTYDAAGRVLTHIQDPDGAAVITRYAYDAMGRTLMVSEAGRSTHYILDAQGRIMSRIQDADGLAITTDYTYTPEGWIATSIQRNDGQDRVMAYTYDALGHCLSITQDPQGLSLTTRYTYDTEGNCITETDPRGYTQYRAYDAAHRLLWSCDANGFVTSYEYDTEGHLIHQLQYAVPVTPDKVDSLPASLVANVHDQHQYFRYEHGKLAEAVDATGALTNYQYDSRGYCIRQTQYAHRANIPEQAGSPLSATPSSADRTSYFSYDGMGRMTSMISPDLAVTTYRYDAQGNCIETTQYSQPLTTADISTLHPTEADRSRYRAYDALGRCIATLDAGAVTTFQYNAAGDITRTIQHARPVPHPIRPHWEQSIVAHADDRISSAIFDTVGRCISRTDSTGQTQTTSYDALGRTRNIHTAQGDDSFRYDAADHMTQKTDRLGHTTQYTYDAAGNLASETRPNGAVWTYSYNALQQRILMRNPYGVETHYQYDAFGNCIEERTESLLTQKTYDAAHHVLSIQTPRVAILSAQAGAVDVRQDVMITRTETFTYNAFGDCVSRTDVAGNITHHLYDRAGRLILDIDSRHGLTEYGYDGLGNRVSTIMYAQALPANVSLEPDKLRQYIRSSTEDRISTCRYDAAGRLLRETRNTVFAYDSNSKTIRPHTPTTAYSYNVWGDILSITTGTDLNPHIARFAYNAMGQKVYEQDAGGYVTTYAYDAQGLLAESRQYANQVDPLAIPAEHTDDRVMQYRYDALGQLTHSTLKQVSASQLNAAQTRYETRAQDLTTSYTYDALGNCIQTTDALGNTVTMTYDLLGQCTSKTGALTQQGRHYTTYHYDAYGHLVASKQYNNNKILTATDTYDAAGHMLSQTDSMGHSVYFSYDAAGNIARRWETINTFTGPQLRDTRYTYDDAGHCIQTDYWTGSTFESDTLTYNRFGECTIKTIGGETRLVADYDTEGRIWRQTESGMTSVLVYDDAGHCTLRVQASALLQDSTFLCAYTYAQQEQILNDILILRTEYQYDALGNLIASSEGSNVTQSYDRWGNMRTYTDAHGVLTTYQYNAFNQLIAQHLPPVLVMDSQGKSIMHQPVVYKAYDALGRLIAVTDSAGNNTLTVLDAEGHTIDSIDALGFHQRKTWDTLGRMVMNEDARGFLTTYTYDDANRLLHIETPNRRMDYQYNEAGERTLQTDGIQSWEGYWYNARGQLEAQSGNWGKTTYTYDAQGRKTGMRDANNNTQSWQYDAQGKLIQHTDLGGHVTQYHYNAHNQVTLESGSTGKALRYTYNPEGQLTGFTDALRGETQSFRYNAAGKLVEKTAHLPDWNLEIDTYSYDAQGRLTEVVRQGAVPTAAPLMRLNYAYDTAGNIRAQSISARITEHTQHTQTDYYTYDATHRMQINQGSLVNGTIGITTQRGTEYIRDAAGNITQAQTGEAGSLQTYTYTYTGDNQLWRIIKNGHDMEVRQYDAAGHLVVQTQYDIYGKKAQKQIVVYGGGHILRTLVEDAGGTLMSSTEFGYDKGEHVTVQATHIRGNGLLQPDIHETHQYTYALWDDYIQTIDYTTLSANNAQTTNSTSTKSLDANGNIASVYQQKENRTTRYIYSTISGMQGRYDSTGYTGFLTVDGKTLGDIHINNANVSTLHLNSGFTPQGSHAASIITQTQTGIGFLFDVIVPNPMGNLQQDIQRVQDVFQEDRPLPASTQDNLGTYTLHSGDTLERIAEQVYGDASLWYLIADANGITDRHAAAGEQGGVLRAGQSLYLPPMGSQHYTDSTHRPISNDTWYGDTRARAPDLSITLPPPPRQHHHSPWKILAKIAMQVITVAATVYTAGVLGVLASGAGWAGVAAQGFAGTMGAGFGLLGGNALLGARLVGGFTAGFIGNLAGQGFANLVHEQKGFSMSSALLSGLSTAAASTLGGLLYRHPGIQDIRIAMEHLSPTPQFNTLAAAEAAERALLHQSIAKGLHQTQHIDWGDIATSMATAGLVGGKYVSAQAHYLEETLPVAGPLINNAAESLAAGSIDHLAHNKPFDVTELLSDNLGQAITQSATQHAVNTLQDSEVEDELVVTQSVVTISKSEASQAKRVHETTKVSDAHASTSKPLITMKQLQKMFPRAKKSLLEQYLPEFNTQLDAAGINTPKRLAYFFATVNEETGGMTQMVENNFRYRSPERARKIFPTKLKNFSDAEIKALGSGEKMANVIYANKNGNGDARSGDGYKYRGRGLFHYTGRENYFNLGGSEFINNPNTVLNIKFDVKSAIRFWMKKNLNSSVDKLNSHILINKNKEITNEYFKRAVKKINGSDVNIYNRAQGYNNYYIMFDEDK